jgi:4-hydroxythreonine-4-phosphate dehydrogenase
MFAYFNAAIDDALAGRVDAIATGPINKAALHMAGISYAGHTEILAQRTQTRDYAMMLAGNRLKVVLATIHVPLARVAEILATSAILMVIKLTDHGLKTRFGISDARIAVAGLNPHAGEKGLFGNEEEKIIQPAVELAISEGIDASGPHPPDTVFFSASQGAYDAVVAMYHDQGLGPFKMIHFNDGVNTTLGLPIVRTSVDHGTAYDIAGLGRASAESMKAAIAMAAKQAEWLRRHRSNSAKPNFLRS